MNSAEHTTREQFVGSIRNALGRSSALKSAPTPPVVDQTLVRLATADDDLVAMFAERAQQVGMDVRRCTRAQVVEQFDAVLTEIGVKRMTLADSTPYFDELQAAAEKRGIELADWRKDRSLSEHYASEAGVCGVHAALAETGSLICCSDARSGRGHSLIPESHIAIVRAGDIVPDMLDYFARLKGTAPAALPSAQAIITGPSKTADIEGVLITGIHGPGRVFVLVVEDDEARTGKQ
jgi:L-lactate dehydrogenase complex protein LldG